MTEQIQNPRENMNCQCQLQSNAQSEATAKIQELSAFYGVSPPHVVFTNELPAPVEDGRTLLGLHCNDCDGGSPVVYLPLNPSMVTTVHEFSHHLADIKGLPNNEEFAEMFTRMHMQEESVWKQEFLGVPVGQWVLSITTGIATGVILFCVLRKGD